MAAVHAKLEKRAAALKDKPVQAARAHALAKASEAPGDDQSGFGFNNGVLTGMEADLESADTAPTAGQREVFQEAAAKIDAAWARWSAWKDHDLAGFNAELKRAGLKPIVLPEGDKLKVDDEDDGEDLP